MKMALQLENKMREVIFAYKIKQSRLFMKPLSCVLVSIHQIHQTPSYDFMNFSNNYYLLKLLAFMWYIKFQNHCKCLCSKAFHCAVISIAVVIHLLG